MARIRTIKPEFFTSEDIVGMTPLARLFYVSLWCEADREGRLEWKPKTLKYRYLPGDDCNIEELTQELVDSGLIVIYEVNGKLYAEIPGFKKHQVINNRESESIIPARVPDASMTRESGVKAERKGKEQEGKGKEGNGREEKTNKKEIPDTGDPADTASVVSLAEPDPDREPDKPPSPVSPHGAIATYVRSMGINAVSTDQELLNLVKAGATMAHFVDAVPVCKERQKGWKYLLGIVKNMLQDAQAPPQPSNRSSPHRFHPKDAWEKINQSLENRHDNADTIDTTVRVVNEK